MTWVRCSSPHGNFMREYANFLTASLSKLLNKLLSKLLSELLLVTC